MRYVVENDVIGVTVDTHGAEMKSLKQKADGREYLWCGDSAYWGRTAPVLFPIVGMVYENRYTYNGVSYEMHQHGFARDKEFSLLKKGENEIWFVLEANEETKKVYPFLFRLEIGYRVEQNTVTVMWKVINQDKKVLEFSIGGHPAFNCPINKEHNQTDYAIQFDTTKPQLTRTVFEHGYACERVESIQLNEDGILPVTEHMFDRDAIIMEHGQSHKVSLLDPKKVPYLTVEFDAPVFGIWSPVRKNAPFICIEPWYGRCDKKGFAGDLSEREWENHLEAGKEFYGEYKIIID